MTTTTERPALLAAFADRERELAAHGPQWLRDARQFALARFAELGFPTTRLEEWKGTSVAKLAATAWQPAPARAVDAAAIDLRGLDALSPHRLVLVDGRVAPELSSLDGLPEGVRAGSLRGALEACPDALEPHLTKLAAYEDRAFTALNTALFEDGAAIQIAAGVELETPIVVVHLMRPGGEPVATHVRTLIVAGDGARGAVLECFAASGEGAYFRNAITEVALGRNTSLEHYRLQDEDPRAWHVGSLDIRQERDSRFTSHNFDLGSTLSRLDSVARLDGEGGECELNGLYLTRGRQHVDNHSVLDHAQPHCSSRELYKGILTDDSRAVFNGRIIVRPGAQKTDAKQSNPNLLLSDRALVQTRPQLEIYADDVKCTHGATIGHLDEAMQFYLRSRGIGREAARNMLIRGFANEVLDRVGPAPLRERLERELASRLGETGGA